jgi:histidine triad (HIT) family protein
MNTYDPQNIFAKILRGEFSSHKVFEDDDVLAVMDVFPQSRGHTLVIPKAPSRNLLDADPAVLSAVMPKVQKVARAVMKATQADGLRLAQFNEAAAGQTVFHLHFHIIPVYEGIPLGQHGGGKADDGELAVLATEIAAAIG